MSLSWVDPHLAALYARREDARVTERLAAELRALAEREPYVPPAQPRPPNWFEQEHELRRRFSGA